MTKVIIQTIVGIPGLTYATRAAIEPGMVRMILNKDGNNVGVDLYPDGMTELLIEQTFFTLLNKLDASKNG